MKLKLYLLISIVFILNIAMKCDEKDAEETIPPKLIGIEIYNVNNEGKNPIVSDEPIKKEAYIIAISYLEEDEYTHADYYLQYNRQYQIGTDILQCRYRYRISCRKRNFQTIFQNNFWSETI